MKKLFGDCLASLRQTRHNIPYFFLSFTILISLIFGQGNKFDTADRLYLVLFFGVIVFPITAVLLFKAKIKISIIELIMLTAFLVFSWISFLFSETKNFGFSEVLAATGAVIIYFAIAMSQKISKRFLQFLVILAFLGSVFGLFYFLTQFEQRVAGPFFEFGRRAHFFPNAFALFLLMTWPIAAYAAFNNWKWWKGIALAVMLSAFILTYSRGGLIVFLIQLVLFLIFFFKKLSLKRVLLVAFITAAVIFASLQIRSLKFPTKSLKERVTLPAAEVHTSFQERLDFFEGAGKLALQKPWFGYGPFSFGYVYRGIQKDLLSISDHPHNVFLKVASENGLPAFFALIGFFIFLLFKFLKSAEKKSFIFIAVLGGLLHNLIDYNFNFITNILIFWILLAFLRVEIAGMEAKFQSRNLKIIPIAFCIFILFLSLYEGYAIYNLSFGKNKITQDLMPRHRYLTDFNSKENLLKHLALNQRDAQAQNLLGELFLKQNDAKTAAIYFQKAISNDPKNWFRYYKNALAALKKSGDRKGFLEMKSKVLNLIDEYMPMFEKNLHFTVFTSNPYEVAAIYELFNENKKAKELRSKADYLKNLITEQQKLNWNKPF